MTPVIQQRVRFRTSPQALFDLYLDSRRRSLSTGAPATISRKVGGKFKAFEGQLEGKNILIVPGRQIVQLWRATHGKRADWSILILTFSPVAGGAQVDLVHVDVPAYDPRASARVGRNTIGARGRNTSANPPRSNEKTLLFSGAEL